MSAHLTDHEISDWTLGIPDAHTLAHLKVCSDCCAELQQLRNTLGEYGEATRTAAARDEVTCARERATIIGKLHEQAPFRFGQLGLAAAMALLVIAVVLIAKLPRGMQRTVAPAPAIVQQQQDSDDDLLVQIQQDLQTDVPEALAPGLVLSAERNRLIAVNGSNPR